MKKAQILSAIALAFALGVVAPVAGVYAVGERSYTDGEEAKTTATVAEVNNAIKNITTAAEYKAYDELAEALDAVETAPKTPGQNETALKSALNAVNAKSYANDADYIALASYAETNVPDYTLWAELVQAEKDVKTDEASTSYAALSKAMKAIRSGYTTVVAGVDNPTATQLLNQAKTDLTTFAAYDAETKTSSTVYTYAKMKAVVNAVNDANTTKTAIKDLSDALTKVGAKADDIKTALEDADPIAELEKLVTGDIETKAGKYDTLRDQITTVENSLKNADTLSAADLYALIDNDTDGLLKLAKAATGNDKLTVSELIGTPVNNPEQPGTTTPGDTNNGDDTKDPSAPGTGIVSTAEGNAATTVSIVAGLATALTALGAGVVAYRSARRSNK